MIRIAPITAVAEFEREAQPGRVLIYFTSDRDEQWHGLAGALRHSRSERRLATVVNAVRRMANAGVVDLVQARCGDEVEYRAVWRRFPWALKERPVPLPMVGENA